MARKGTITLSQGVGKSSGKPFTALKLTVGKWSALHFPTQFERDYLVNYLKNNQGEITLAQKDGALTLIAGEYIHTYTVESSFEYKYIKHFLNSADEKAPVNNENDGKIDLDSEDDIDTTGGLFS